MLSAPIVAAAATAEKPPSLEQVRDLIAAKKTAEAVGILKTDWQRLLKTEKDYHDVTQWLSIFLYENSMELYEKAEELAPTDAGGATEQFEQLMEKEPYNKIAISSYLAFLIDQKKYTVAQILLDRALLQFPYFPVFSVYKTLLLEAQDQAGATVACDKKSMGAVELELCQLSHLVVKVKARDAKRKPSEQELKNLAGKTTIPDAQYWVWVATKNENYLKRYVSLCQGLTEKYKKNYRIVPGLCAKMQEAQSQLESKQNDEPNAS